MSLVEMIMNDEKETTTTTKKQTKSQKKHSKKYHKKVLNFLKEYDNKNSNNGVVSISDEPTSHLFIGNGGMLCGVSRGDILTLFKKYGNITDLLLLPKKSFSLISFSDIDSAKQAFYNMDGYICTKKIKTDSISEDSTAHSTAETTSNVTVNNTEPIAPFYLKYLKTQSLEFAYENDNSCEFPIECEPNLVADLILREEFVDENYERRLYNFFHERCIQQQDFDKEAVLQSAQNICRKCKHTGRDLLGSGNILKHRNVVHFGYKFMYGSNNIDRNNPLPEGVPPICQLIIQKMIDEEIVHFIPDQLTVNQYFPGQGIPPHIDTHSAFEDGIISLSLNSQVTMEFTSPDGISRPVLLPPRSLIVMKGESRYLWSHGITPRKFDIISTKESNDKNSRGSLTIRERGIRISLTFRKILHKPCTCLFPLKCDSQSKDLSMKNWFVPESQDEASNLEGELVYRVYEEIAEHFSDTRHSPWPQVKQFLCNLPNNSLVADVGCGNGKYLGVNKNLVMLGSDRSYNLAKICQERGHKVLVSDCLQLPYRTECCDGCICIAVIHHLSTKERRLEAVKELVRIVRKGGRILIYVWALEQQLKEERSDETVSLETVENNQSSNGNEDPPLCDTSSKSTENNKNFIPVCEGRNTFQQQDLLVPWHLKSNKNIKAVESNQVVSLPENNKECGEKVFHRFYHVFKAGELRALCTEITNVTIEEIYLDCGNWCAILQKI